MAWRARQAARDHLLSGWPEIPGLSLTEADFMAARADIQPHVHRTPMLTSRTLSEECGLEVHLKAEMFQLGGSYKVRGPLHQLARMPPGRRSRGVVCSSAGNHSQGVAIAAGIYGVPAVVVMAENATPSKIAATEGYGARVVLHGRIWDEANERALSLARERGLTYIHPFDTPELMAGQGTVGLEILDQCPDVELVVVPVGGGGLISGIAMAVKALNPGVRVIGVESAGAPAMKRSVESGRRVTLDHVDCVIDGLRVMRVGEHTRSVVSRYVDELVTVADAEIFEAVLYLMTRAKLVAEGAAAATVAALLGRHVGAAPGTKTVCVLSGGNLDVQKLRGLAWN